MPGPFEQSSPPDADKVVALLEKGGRARQVLQLGVGNDIARRRDGIYRLAERELRSGTLTPDRALMHIACANGLSRYLEELTTDVTNAQVAADTLHATESDTEDENV